MTATEQRITETEYLATTFHPDAEFVNGEIRQRNMGTLDHADWQGAIYRWFIQNGNKWYVAAYVELRMKVSPEGDHLIPDVLVLDANKPKKQVPDEPPIAVFEVISPDDKFLELYSKLRAYHRMGIEQIWIVDPKDGVFKRYQDDMLVPQSEFSSDSYGIRFNLSEIAKLLLN